MQVKRELKSLLLENVFVPIAMGAFSCLILGIFTYKVENANSWVAHSDEVITTSESLQKVVADAQASYRGFLLVKKHDYLQRYESAEKERRDVVAKLASLVQDNPEQAARVDEARRLVDEWFGFTRSNIALAEISFERALARFAMGEGERKVVAIQRVLEGATNTEFRLREQRALELRRISWVSLSLFIIVLLLGNTAIAVRGRRSVLRVSESYSKILDENQDRLAQLKERTWLQETESQLSLELLKANGIEGLAEKALTFLIERFGGLAGSIVMRDTIRSESPLWKRKASIGVDSPETVTVKNSLLERIFASKQPAVFDNFAEHHWRLRSVTGEHAPRFILMAPLLLGDQVVALVEIAFNSEPSPQALRFLQQSGEKLGSIFANESAKDRILKLYADLERNQRELEAQQEELHAVNDELEARACMLREAQTRSDAANVELEEANLRLQEQARNLEERTDQLAFRNAELVDVKARLEAQASDLQTASRHKSQFLANMSHELRTPLNSAMILAQVMIENREGNLTPKQIESARQILKSGESLLALINDILDLSKVEAGAVQIEFGRFEIAEVLAWARATFAPLCREKGLALVVRDEDSTLPISTDRTRLQQILANLLSNAVKFTEKGRITLSHAIETGSAGDRWVRFTVSDMGVGIPEDRLEIIFEPFRQADETVTRRFGGTGLGLTISRNLAHLLGGRLEVESKVGEGSTFHLLLPFEAASVRPVPVARSEARGGPGLAAHDGRSSTDSKLILVIEDDESFGSILREHIEARGFECLVVATATEGQAFAIERRPRAIILDINLPDFSGLVVLDRLRANPETRMIPVHVVSVVDATALIEDLGAFQILQKPLSLNGVRNLVDQIALLSDAPSPSILMVEDDENQIAAIKPLLESKGARVEVVLAGKDAVSKVLSGTAYHCLILDLKLPDISGLQVLREIVRVKGRGSCPPVIVHTAADLSRAEQRELESIANSLIVKGNSSLDRLLDEVSVFLKKAAGPGSPQATFRTSRGKESLQGKTVLLVDDDVRNTMAMKTALEAAEATVVVAHDGQEALDHLHVQDTAIDIVLMDVMMPVMDGLDAIRAMRGQSRFADLPVIALTAKAMKDDRESCIAAGANDYLSKPIDVQKLFSLIRIWTSKV